MTPALRGKYHNEVSAFRPQFRIDALDCDDPAVKEHWCGERRQVVTEYLAKSMVRSGIGQLGTSLLTSRSRLSKA